MSLQAQESHAVLSLCLLASFADGEKHERERAEIRRVAEGFSSTDGGAIPLSTLYQDVLMKRIALSDVVAQLKSADMKRLGYEMAVCVCDADGTLSDAEQRFLGEARVLLGLDDSTSADFTQQAQSLAASPVAAADTSPAGALAASSPEAVDRTELDGAILSAAIVNGALELLPESLSTLAIIPLQMKLVYRIGKAYGFELDSGHVKDFLATAGVGLTSQYLEQAGRKLLGGLLGKAGGSLLRGVGRQAVSSSMSFAITYALGHVAKRYYAGGRSLSTQMLKDAYASTLKEAQALSRRYLPEIQERANTLDVGKVLSMVRSG